MADTEIGPNVPLSRDQLLASSLWLRVSNAGQKPVVRWTSRDSPFDFLVATTPERRQAGNMKGFVIDGKYFRNISEIKSCKFAPFRWASKRRRREDLDSVLNKSSSSSKRNPQTVLDLPEFLSGVLKQIKNCFIGVLSLFNVYLYLAKKSYK